MKSLFAKFTPHQGLGLYIGERELALSHVASTPRGLVELERRSTTYEPENLADTLAEFLRPLAGHRRLLTHLVLGISPRHVFYSTRPLDSDNQQATPQALLRDMLQSPNVCIDEMIVEMIKSEYGKRTLVSVASCRKEYLVGLLQALEKVGVQPLRTEPAPLALWRAGTHRRRARRNKPVIRLLLGQEEALAVVSAGTTCVLWKLVPLARGRELPALCAAVRSCQSLAFRCGVEALPEAVLIQGRADLQPALTSGELSQKVQLPVVSCDAVDSTAGEVAFGLALSYLSQTSCEGLDLSRSMTPAPSVWQIFPWGEAAVQVALLVCMGLFMLTASHTAQNNLRPVRKELAKRSWVGSRNAAELSKEQQDLAQRVDAVRKFVTSRVIWTQYTSDIAQCLPITATMTSFAGVSELGDINKANSVPKKSLTIRGSAAIDKDGATPHEIDQFLDALRHAELLRRHFPNVALADIKCPEKRVKGAPREANFTVVCLPKTVPRSPKKGPK